MDVIGEGNNSSGCYRSSEGSNPNGCYRWGCIVNCDFNYACLCF